MTLTRRQKELLDHLEGYLVEHGYSPSYEEIAAHFGFSSLATVHEHLENLQEKGYIRRSRHRSRSIEIQRRESPAQAVELPLLGYVAAGEPIEAVSVQDSIDVPSEMLGRGTGQHYVLRVKGNSMIDEQIRDGDFIVVSNRQTANNGEMVVALVEMETATVKKLYREPDGKIRLQPAHPEMEPLYYGPDEVVIQGVVLGVIRRY